MKKGLRALLIVAAALCALVAALWFIPAAPGLWGEQEASAGYVGAFEKNGALDKLSFLPLGYYTRPETVLCRDGYVYTGVSGGVLLRIEENSGETVKLLETGGCILGIAFDRDGDVLIADCAYNDSGAILKANAETGEYSVLVSRATGMELYYPNAITVASSGEVYFTDSTSVFKPSDFAGDSYAAAVNEALMHTATGRIIMYDPEIDGVSVIARGMDFSNGIALSADEKSLYVCETYLYSVMKVNIATGESTPFLSDLPGFPDNLTEGEGGRYWVGLANVRSASLDEISGRPLLRKCVWLYGKLFPAAEEEAGGYGCVFAFNESGEVVECLQSGSNGYYKNTGATETAERLYIQSVNRDGKLAYVER